MINKTIRANPKIDTVIHTLPCFYLIFAWHKIFEYKRNCFPERQAPTIYYGDNVEKDVIKCYEYVLNLQHFPFKYIHIRIYFPQHFYAYI